MSSDAPAAAQPDGYRGYIGSRPIRGTSFAQKLQNLVVREYAARTGLRYKLSLVEYAMPACYMLLDDALAELPTLQGVIAFSAFMLPKRKARRQQVYDRVLAAGRELHFAFENLAIRTAGDVQRVEDLLDVAAALAAVPAGGRCEKVTADVDRRDPFWATLARATSGGVTAGPC